jgi:hypothetical protein
MTTVNPRPRLPLILLAMAFIASPAFAQSLPWPTDPPGNRPATAPATAAPAPAPMMAPAASGFEAPRPQPSADCGAKFTELRGNAERLRDSLEKVAASARSQSEKRASRDDFCKAITIYAAAEGKWAKFTADNVARCGIPPEVAKQLTAVHAKTMVSQKNICSVGPQQGAPAAPSLSDALGTARRPLLEGNQSGRGTFDTLTGNVIAR